MQEYSEKVKICSNDKLGRHLVAGVDLSAGEVLLEEMPLLVAPHWDSAQMKCSQCMQDSFLMCKKCQFFPLCLNCSAHDEFDCAFFCSTAQHISKDFLVENYATYAALKLLLLMENPQTCQRCELLRVHDYPLEVARQRCDSVLWRDLQAKVVTPLLYSGLANVFKCNALTAELLHAICLRIDESAFEVTAKDGDSLKGVYVGAAQLPHSCVPNTVIAFDDDCRICVYASVPLRSGEVLYNSCTNPLMGTSQRQHELRLTKHIDCDCVRCSDPTELGTHMSSIKCQRCVDGYLTAVAKSGDWRCSGCGATLATAEINQLLAQAGEALLEADGDLQAHERLLQQFAARFHPNHFVLLEIKQNIALMLRGLLMDPMCARSNALLERKLQLCEQLLPVVRAVLPGISTLYGIALYEYFLSFVELTEQEFAAKLPDNAAELIMEKLEKSKEIAANAKEMLSFEPKNSPKARLLRSIAKRLKRFEEKLNRLATIKLNHTG